MEGFSCGKDQNEGMQPGCDLSCRDAQTVSLSQEQVLLTADCLGEQTIVCKILISTHFLKVSKLQDGDCTENAEDLQLNILICVQLNVVHISVEEIPWISPLLRLPKALKAGTPMCFSC